MSQMHENLFPGSKCRSTSFSNSIHQEDSLLSVCIFEDLCTISISLAQQGEGKPTFAAHESSVASSLSTFPEPTASLSYEYCFADSAVLWPVDLLARAETTIQR